MDVYTADVEPTIEHEDTAISYFMIPKGAMRDSSQGGYLEFVCEFQTAHGKRIATHRHNSDEFYYILRGEAKVEVDGEERTLRPGDLLRIPPNAAHSIWPTSEEGFRGFAFAVNYDLTETDA